MEHLIAFLIWKLNKKQLLVKPINNNSSNSEWLVNITNYGKSENKIFYGENEKIIRERIISLKPNATINHIYCLNGN